MVSTNTAQEIFLKIQEDPQNRQCFQCEADNPTWGSLSFGILLCGNCSNLHRSLDLKVKSMIEEWSIPQLRLMICGGNSSLREYFEAYPFEEASAEHKFKSKAGKYYKDMLVVLASGEDYNQPQPSPEEGILPYEPKGIKGWFKRAVDAGKSTARKIEASETFKKLERGTNEAVAKAESSWKRFSESERVKNFSEKTSAALEKFRDKTQTSIDRFNSNPRVQRAKAESWKFLNDLEDSMKRGATKAYQKLNGSERPEGYERLDG